MGDRDVLLARRAALEAELLRAEAEAAAAVASAQRAMTESAERMDGDRTAWLRRRTAVVDAQSPAVVDAWDSPRWDTWAPPGPGASAPAWLRLGDREGINNTRVPVLAPFVGSDRSLVIASSGSSGAERARRLLQSIALRAALSLSHTGRLCLIDAYRGGYTFPFVDALPYRVQAPSARDGLTSVLASCTDIKTTFQHTPFDQVPPDQRRGRQFAVVLVADFPRDWSSSDVTLLHRVVRERPTGVIVVVHHDLDADRPGTHDDLDLTAPYVVHLDDETATVLGPGGGPLTIDEPPESPWARTALARVAASRPEDTAVAWRAVNPGGPADWWSGSAATGVRAAVGADDEGRAFELGFDDDRALPRAHAVQAGTTGMGKSNFVRALIMSLATRYSPDELALYLIDGQDGVTFNVFRDLPHVRVLSMRTSPPMLREVVHEVTAEMARRNALLRGSRVERFDDLRAQGISLPRLVLVVDEYQAVFDGDPQGEGAKAFIRIAEQGRKVGIHLYLSSQGFVTGGFGEKFMRNLTTRVAFKMDGSSGVAGALGREGRDLVARHATTRGVAVVNEAGGDDGSNHVVRAALLEQDETVRLLAELASLPHHDDDLRVRLDGEVHPQLGDDRVLARLRGGDPLADVLDSGRHRGGLATTMWVAADHPLPLLLGRQARVHGTQAPLLTRTHQQNVLAVGENLELLVGPLASALVGAAWAAPRGGLDVRLAHDAPAGGSWDGVLGNGVAAVLAHRGQRLTGGDASAVIDAALAEVDRRQVMTTGDLRTEPTVVLVAVELDRCRDLVQVDGRWGPEPSPAGASLTRVLQEGPAVGVHAILAFRHVRSWLRTMPRGSRDSFAHVVVQQMGDDDSIDLLGSTRGAHVDQDDELISRCGYFDVHGNQFATFFPFTTAGRAEDDRLQIVGTPTLLDQLLAWAAASSDVREAAP